MYALQDKQGRKVVVKSTGRHGDGATLVAIDGVNEEVVPEATIIHFGGDKEDDTLLLVPGKDFFDEKFKAAGFSPASYQFASKTNLDHHSSHLDVHMQHRYGGYGWSRTRTEEHHINHQKVDEPTYKRMCDLLGECRSYEWLAIGYTHVRPWSRHADHEGRVDLDPQQCLELIGIGKTVTADSIKKACAKDETRPRLWLGDTVEVKMARKTVLGTVVGLGKKVSVLRTDTKKGNYAYNKVFRTDKALTFDDDALAKLDPTLKANFDYVLAQAHRIYRAAITVRESVKFPAFPGPDDREYDMRELTNAATCECPLCGWPMADFNKCNEFQCCMCRVRGIIATQDNDTVTLLMLRQPAKNQFAIREAKCCGNCGLFNFEYGRQGKRSTGYCQATNQCVQAHSTCVSADGKEGYWFPRKPGAYSKQMTQHVTNLGYGVSDHRNTGRQDIRDTIYTADDHKAQRKRADEARKAYEAAYSKFMSDLGKMSPASTFSGELTDEKKAELREHFQKVLDEGC